MTSPEPMRATFRVLNDVMDEIEQILARRAKAAAATAAR
jgi:hypothetical protein